MKPAWKSRTIWLGIATFVAGGIGAVLADNIVAEHPIAVSVLAAIQGGLLIWLRTNTSEPIK